MSSDTATIAVYDAAGKFKYEKKVLRKRWSKEDRERVWRVR